MDNRTRIINTVLGKSVDRRPNFCVFGLWGGVEAQWQREGMEGAWQQALGFDEGFEIIDVNLGYLPAFEYKVIEDRGETRIIQDERGVLQQIRMDYGTVPRFLDFPVKDEADWERLKARLDPDDPKRFPADWDQKCLHYDNTHAALQLGSWPYGLFGTLREMMGVENLLVAFYDMPELIHEMMDYLTDFWIAIYQKVARRVRVDMVHMWEDMSGKTGPLISPAMIREFMVPNYRKIAGFAEKNNIPIFSVDTDGDCSLLAEPFMEGGVNMLMPMEVQAGCDVREYARRWPGLCVAGGFDKRCMWTSEAAMDAEFERLSPMAREGVRYILSPDHLIPPEVSFAHMRHYAARARAWAGI